MSIKSYLYTNSNGVTSEKWYFAVRYKDSSGCIRQRKGTGFSSYQEAEKAQAVFLDHITFMNMSYDELLRFYREHIDEVEAANAAVINL